MSAIPSIQNTARTWLDTPLSPKKESLPSSNNSGDVSVISDAGYESARLYAEAQNKGTSTSDLAQRHDTIEKASFFWDTRETANLADGEGVTTTSPHGTVVNVARIPASESGEISPYTAQVTRKDGLQITFELTGNVRVNDRDDGSLAILFADTGETHVYSPDGTKSILQGEAGSFAGTEGNDIFINLNATSVDGGEGDDTIINFADNASLNGGNGNDTIILGREVAGNAIDTGEGNDSLLGVGARNSSIRMGEGNNTVDLDVLEGASELSLGDGDNVVGIDIVGSAIRPNTTGQPDSVITIGDGNNRFTAGITGINAKVYMGDGNNSISSQTISGLLHVGNGNNTLTAKWMQVGDSDIRSSASSYGYKQTQPGGIVELGNGNNTVDVDEMTTGSLLQAGNGNNEINFRIGANGSKVELGDGNNKISFDSTVFMDIVAGNGNNIIVGRALTRSTIITGSGDDHIAVVHGSGSVNSGGGNDIVGIGSSFLQGQVDVGEGNNTVIAFGGLFSLAGGAGNNTLYGNPLIIQELTDKFTVQRGETSMTQALREAFKLYDPYLSSDEKPAAPQE